MTYWRGEVSNSAATARAGWLFSSRRGGYSLAPFDDWNLGAYVGDDHAAVARNRARLAALAGVDDLVVMKQCHSANVAVVTQAGAHELVDFDAVVTTAAGVGVVAMSADCVPVALVDVEAQVVAAVHSGWQGMVADVVGATVAQMQELGATTAGIRAILGPAICGSCYAVPAERAAAAAAAWPAAAAVASDGQPAIDVRAGLQQRLGQLDIHAELVGGCTAEDAHLFSYRRDQLTGRQGVVVWWEHMDSR